MILIFCTMLLIISALGENCDDIVCANVFDSVCGMSESKTGTQFIQKYKNMCYMRKTACELKSLLETYQVADELCHIKKKKMRDPYGSRRVKDFSVIGAHQACNHSCPIYCTDTYDPACAQIWKPNMDGSSFRPMINHCHIDLFSCAAAVNVTIHPLGKCYKNPSGLLFIKNIAGLQRLKLLDSEKDRDHKPLPKLLQGRKNEVKHDVGVPGAIVFNVGT